MLKKSLSKLVMLIALVFGQYAVNAQCQTPTNLGATINGPSMLLTWNAVGGATSYRVNIQNAPGNNVFLDVEFNSATNSFMAMNLTPGSNYKFKVRTNCGGNNSAWSGYFFFTANGAACNPLQITGVTTINNVNHTTTINWNAVPGVSSYRVRIENGQNNPVPFAFVRNPITNMLTVSVLAPATNYKVKVRANCNGNLGPWSVWKQFTTGPARIGNNTVAENITIDAYPNPANDLLQFEVSGKINSEKIMAQLFSLTGMKTAEFNFNVSEDELSINTQNIPAGIYMLKINDGTNAITKRISIVH